MGFLQPSPAVMALLSLQTFFYLPLLAMLAAARAGAARGPSRWLGLASLALALLGMAAHFVPPLFNLYTGTLPQVAAMVTKPLGGMALPLVASAPLIASAFAAGRAWRWVDVVHVLLLAVLIGLWGYTRVY
ncbi:hypothetical protein [Marinovum sp.]|uniref:hypothetical protein n=1 Tax=Marinovum sp. TaxID=2024839 RepID=UPI003A8E21D1